MDHPALLGELDRLAVAYVKLRQYENAAPLYLRLPQLWESSFGSEHPMIALTLDKIAVFYREQENFDEAREAGERATVVREKFLAGGLRREADELVSRRRGKEAAPIYDLALAVLEAHHTEHETMIRDIEKRLENMKNPPRRK